jgi:hypothetical protein
VLRMRCIRSNTPAFAALEEYSQRLVTTCALRMLGFLRNVRIERGTVVGAASFRSTVVLPCLVGALIALSITKVPETALESISFDQCQMYLSE